MIPVDSEDEHSEGSELEELAEPIDTDGSDGEGQPFDITLAATHSVSTIVPTCLR